MSALLSKSLAAPAAATPPPARGMRLVRAYMRNRMALFGLLLMLVVLFLAVFAPWIAPQNPYDLKQLSLMDARRPPGTESMAGFTFVLGTDALGRDIWSGILYGLRISLTVAVVSALVALTIGSTLGLTAAWRGGRTDALIMRIVDLQMSFPSILVALILLAVLGRGVDKTIIALVTVQWAYYARTIRASAMIEREKEYIEAASCMRLGAWRIMTRHLLPNCLPPLMVVVTVQIAHAISLEATLSFLGIGLPETEPSLGLLIASGYAHLLTGTYWISIFPGIALLIAIFAINLVADHLRDLLNPRLAR